MSGTHCHDDLVTGLHVPRDPSLVFGCKGALVTSKGIVLILLEGDLVTDRQTDILLKAI